MREHKLYGKLSKCMFMRKELDYLGHVISGEGISVDPSKIEAVKDWATPQDLKQLQSFLGLCNLFWLAVLPKICEKLLNNSITLE
jgi:hypothetical protein